MPRFPTVEKTIHGKLVTQTVFLNAILALIQNFPDGARAGDIIGDLGEEWMAPDRKRLLASTLINMAKRGTLVQVENEKGLYRATNFARRNGVNNFDGVEKSILSVIREHGGFCRYKDILVAHDVNPVGEEKWRVSDPIYSRINDVIRKSELIRQDAGERGVYNLPWDECLTLPLRGYYAALLVKTTWEENRKPGDTADDRKTGWRALRDSLFYNVGLAFRQLRELRGWSVDDLLAHKPVYAAMAELQRRAPNEIAIIRQDVFDRTSVTVEEMRAAGASQEEVEAYREARVEELNRRQLEWLYKRFERGELGAHYHAPLAFYTSIAALYDVCPASLSRGVITFKPYDDVRIRPERTRRHVNDIAMARADLESEMEFQARMFAEMNVRDDLDEELGSVSPEEFVEEEA